MKRKIKAIEVRGMNFCCPKCGGELCEQDGVFRCENRHCYDRAKSGYINLLSGAGGVHGDDKRMVQARRAFLDGGGYRPLMKEVAEWSRELLPSGGVLLDCGCGEGSYTAAVSEALLASGKEASVLGVDISKDAVALAAKRAKQGKFAVASVFHLPLSDRSVDGILNLFAPMVAGEYARVLRAGGWVMKATPLPEHLYELKAAVYDRPYLTQPEPERWEGFDLWEKREVKFSLLLQDNAEVQSLFEMTPYCYTTPRSGMERLAKLSSLTVTAAFCLALYRKKEGAE